MIIVDCQSRREKKSMTNDRIKGNNHRLSIEHLTKHTRSLKMVYGYDGCVIVYVNIFEEFQVVDFWQRKHSLRRIWIRWTELFLLDPSASKEFRSNNPTLSQATEKFRLRTLCPSIETSHPVIGGSSAKVATRSLFLFFSFFFFLFLFHRFFFFLPFPLFFCTGTRSSFLEASLWATSEVMHDKKALRLRRCTENFNKHREKKVNPCIVESCTGAES